MPCSASAPRLLTLSGGSHPVLLRTKARKLSLPGLLCGKTGIRTLGARKGTTVFETAPIDHSGIFPYISRGRTCRFVAAKVLNVFDVRNIRTRISKFNLSVHMQEESNYPLPQPFVTGGNFMVGV